MTEINDRDPATIENPPEAELCREVRALRNKVHAEMKIELTERIKKNPTPTDEEIALGAFIEQLEPHVRETILILNRKGFATSSSGFATGTDQMIDGFMNVNDQEKEAIEKTGARVEVLENGYTFIRFMAEEANLIKLEQKCLAIAEALPSRGHPATVEIPSVATESFWKKYCRPEDVERVRIERRLAVGKIYAHETREELEAKVKRLKNR